jgi:anti-sigma regulatory factor (Ser/Thr protein kinase)
MIDAEGTGLPVLLYQTFDRGFLTTTRHAVARQLSAAGLHGRAYEDFLLAITEVITNAVMHGGGQGDLRLWRIDGRLHCEVADRGPGSAPERLAGLALPSAHAVGGRGMFLVRQLCADVSIDSGPTGTTVRLTWPVPR